MSKVLIIGCGGVASVAIHKCCQVPEVFTEICIASRTKAKCDKLAAELAPKTTTKITTAQVDADHVDESSPSSRATSRSGDEHRPALSGSDHHGCLPACGVNYMDTANYEPENTDDPECAPFTRSAARRPVSPPTLITAGSGPTPRSLRRPA